MKSRCFLSFNMISFVPNAFCFLTSSPRLNRLVPDADRWHQPQTTPQPVDAVVVNIRDPDLLCLSGCV
ncbi:hypothetical protein DSCW_48510 [Desulfosarcina widdelii]|uniref:Secreted protein n=1 Tax=Desulfosarcina widdelii TaxID=947919 RepID=A0A5K7ZGH1_9BACT|nr:hypothetical protein DSCW_48510 [Desulfosarcina widdelii]